MSYYILFMCNFYWDYPSCSTVIFPDVIQCEHAVKILRSKGTREVGSWCQEVKETKNRRGK